LPFQVPADAQRQNLGQPGELGARRRLHPAEALCAVGPLDIHPVDKQRVEVNVQIQRAAEERN
jgi:hypothetical protein